MAHGSFAEPDDPLPGHDRDSRADHPAHLAADLGWARKPHPRWSEPEPQARIATTSTAQVAQSHHVSSGWSALIGLPG